MDSLNDREIIEPDSKATTEMVDMSAAWQSYYKKINDSTNCGASKTV